MGTPSQRKAGDSGSDDAIQDGPQRLGDHLTHLLVDVQGTSDRIGDVVVRATDAPGPRRSHLLHEGPRAGPDHSADSAPPMIRAMSAASTRVKVRPSPAARAPAPRGGARASS